MTDDTLASQPLARFASGVSGLDVILQGGFFRGGIYIIMGSPGTGKTILGNQICFNYVKNGGRAVYVTLLAESHARMLAHLQGLSFFTPDPVADELYYISGYRELRQEGLKGLLNLIRRIVRERRANLLVLDGVAAAEAAAASDLDFKQFIHELHVFSEATRCTTFMLTHVGDSKDYRPEHTMVDGLIELSDQLIGLRALRELRVIKFRGSDSLRGRHIFQITNNGLEVYPRTEALMASIRPPAEEQRSRMGFGIAQLDKMTGGGLLSGSTTMLLGPTGSGKTLLGLNFLAAGARSGENGLYFGFYESTPRVIGKADQTGLDFSSFVKSNTIELFWQTPVENYLDALAERMITAIKQRKVRRLFIDGLGGFQEATDYPERVARFFTALTEQLRTLDVTTVFSVEAPNLLTPIANVPVNWVSATVENTLLLRYVEVGAQLYRLISVLKMRESDYDSSVREFRISGQGFEVAGSSETAEQLLSRVSNLPTLRRTTRFKRGE